MKYAIAAVVGLVALAGAGTWFYTRDNEVTDEAPIDPVEDPVEETSI